MVRYVGIDYSMSSPSMCVSTDKRVLWDTCSVYYLTGSRKFVGERGNMSGVLSPKWKTAEQRFDQLSDFFVSKLWTGDLVIIEGYAFGAKGQVFHIGENTGLLKHKLHSRGIEFETVQPSVIKKFATGKGNADKAAMNVAFEEHTGISVKKILAASETQWNPSSDVVDSYYMCKYAAKFFCQRGLLDQ